LGLVEKTSEADRAAERPYEVLTTGTKWAVTHHQSLHSSTLARCSIYRLDKVHGSFFLNELTSKCKHDALPVQPPLAAQLGAGGLPSATFSRNPLVINRMGHKEDLFRTRTII
jgi:hypothetical protein